MPTNDETPEDAFQRETTQNRAKVLAEGMWGDLNARFGQLAGLLGLGSILIGAGMFLAGRASGADLEDTKGRTVKLETAFSEHRHNTELTEQRVQKQLDEVDHKIDRLGENIYRMALRSNVPALAPPKPTTPATPERIER